MVTNNHVLKDMNTVTIYKEARNYTVISEKIVLNNLSLDMKQKIYALDLKDYNMSLIGFLPSCYAQVINEELDIRDNLTLSIGIDINALKVIKEKIANLYKKLTEKDID